MLRVPPQLAPDTATLRMKIAVPSESTPGETRVALVPETIAKLTRDGHSVSVEGGAGDAAGFRDADFTEAGATIASSATDAMSGADVICKVGPPTADEIAALGSGQLIIGVLGARTDADLMASISASGASAAAMEMVPRIARAQRLDVLSSQASLAGYKSVLIGANSIGRFFPLMMTAAGTIPPANVLVLGAGVAGLQAIATAKRLGAVVSAYDVRSAVREQVESLGGKFIEIEQAEDAEDAGGYAKEQSEADQARQREAMTSHIANSDVVITTANVPGRKAPTLVTAAMVEAMRPGSVIVDLAGESGGNCELSDPGNEVSANGVTIHAPLNVPAMMPTEASVLYSRNLVGLLELVTDEDGALKIDMEDEVIGGTVVAHGGSLVGPLAG